MKAWATILVLLVCQSCLFATNVSSVRKDTHFPVILEAEVSTASAKIGDTVKFRTSEGVLIGNNVVVPRGAQILGTVDEVKRNAPNVPRSVLVIRLHTVRWPEGYASLNAVVLSVESITQSENVLFREIRTLFSRPTLLEHIHVYAHIQRDAYTEFSSDTPELVLRRGIRLELWHLDPEHVPEMMVQNPVLNVNRW